MGRAHVGVSIPIQFTSWNVATGAHAFGRDLLALGALVLLVSVALEDVLSSKLHGALRALPRLLVSMHLLQVVGELKVCFEFDLADLARNFVGLARRNVHVLVVRSPLLEDLPTISACQGAIFRCASIFVVLGNATSQRVHLHGFEMVFAMSAMAPRLQSWKKKWLREIR